VSLTNGQPQTIPSGQTSASQVFSIYDDQFWWPTSKFGTITYNTAGAEAGTSVQLVITENSVPRLLMNFINTQSDGTYTFINQGMAIKVNVTRNFSP